MRVLVCGDRNWSDMDLIKCALVDIEATEVVHGGCRGADLLGLEAAEFLGLDVVAYPADWNRYGRAAGPIRNQQMLDMGEPDMVFAFHNDIDASRGTKDMLRRADIAGVPNQLFTHRDHKGRPQL